MAVVARVRNVLQDIIQRHRVRLQLVPQPAQREPIQLRELHLALVARQDIIRVHQLSQVARAAQRAIIQRLLVRYQHVLSPAQQEPTLLLGHPHAQIVRLATIQVPLLSQAARVARQATIQRLQARPQHVLQSARREPIQWPEHPLVQAVQRDITRRLPAKL